MGALFTCAYRPIGEGKWEATSEDFPGLFGYGRTSEEARASLANLVMRFYRAARREEVSIEI